MNFLKDIIVPCSACVSCFSGLALSVRAGEGDRAVRIRQVKDVIRVEINGALFTEYHFSDADRPYFYPVIGPTGKNVTRNWPMKEVEGESTDHEHHRGLWYTHGDVNGHDFWSEGRGPKIVQTKIVELTSGEDSGTIMTESEWGDKDGQIVCTDTRRHTFYSRSDSKMMDIEITLNAAGDDLVLGDTKEGSMAIRLASTMRVKGGDGQIVNSEGDRDKKTWGKRAAWCDYSGPVEGETVGVAIFDHPGNPRHPTWWHVRVYGLFAANPFGLHYFEKKPEGTGDLTVPSGKSVTFRYRILFHRGDEKHGDVAGEYEKFCR